jgi:hypothetical protein
MPSTAGYLVATALLSLCVFFGVWWLLSEAEGDAPWLTAAVGASFVVLVSVAAREVVMRRAWARYTRELELEMRTGAGQHGVVGPAPAPPRKANVRTTAASLRDLQQRLAQAEEQGVSQPEAHREAYRLCEQYVATTDEAMRASGVTTEMRVALRAGRERVRELQKHHLLSWVRGEARRLTHEAQRRASVSGKIETAMRAVEVIDDARRIYPEEPELRDSSTAVRNFIASVKVAHWVELAERAAFRGRYNRAVARYRDALFYLSRAEMSDDARDAAAQRINREIEMLRARIATDGDGSDARSRPARAARRPARREG